MVEFVFFWVLVAGIVAGVHLLRRIQRLERTVRQLQRTTNMAAITEDVAERAVTPPPVATTVPTAEPPAPAYPPMPPAPSKPPVAIRQVPAAPAPVPQIPRPAPAPVPQIPRPAPARPAVPKRPSRTQAEWELLLGGKVMNRIGAIAMVIGALLFFKWAVDYNVISPWLRVIVGLATGTVALAIAPQMVRRGFDILAQGMAAVGAALLYLSVYATYGFYDLVAQPVAFVAMTGVTVVVLWRALAHRSYFLAVLASAGGMATPAVLSSGSVNTTGLFTYLALIDLMLIGAVVGSRRWASLLSVARGGTIVWWFLWGTTITSVKAEEPAATFFGVLFLLMWLMIPLVMRRASLPHDTLSTVLTAISTAIQAGIVGTLLYATSPWASAGALAGIAILLVTTTGLFRRRGDLDLLESCFVALAAVLTVAAAGATPMDIFGRTMATLGVAIVIRRWFTGYRFELPYWTAAAMAVLAILVVMGHPLLWIPAQDAVALPFLTTRFATFLVIAAFVWLGLPAPPSRPTLTKVTDAIVPQAWLVVAIAIGLECYHGIADGAVRAAADAAGYPFQRLWTAAIAGVSIATSLATVVGIVASIRKKQTLVTGSHIVAGTGAALWAFHAALMPLGDGYTSVFNLRVASAVVLLIGTSIALWRQRPSDTSIAASTLGWWSIAVVSYTVATAEITAASTMQRQALATADSGVLRHAVLLWRLMLPTAWMVLGAVLAMAGRHRRFRPLEYGATAVFALFAMLLMTAAWSFAMLGNHLPMLGPHTVATASAFALAYLQYRQTRKTGTPAVAIDATLWATMLVASLVTMQELAFDLASMVRWTSKFQPMFPPLYGCAGAAAAVLWAMAFALGGKHPRWVGLVIRGGFSVGIVWWCMAAASLWLATHQSILLNGRVATAALIIVAGTLMLRRLPTASVWRYDRTLVWTGMLTTLFVMLTMEIIDPFQMHIHNVIARYGWSEGGPLATSLDNTMHVVMSCAWIAYAATIMVFGFIRRKRLVRLVGMAGLGLSVLKVFLYDLGRLGTPYRIMSFICLGIILFAGSYIYQRFKDRILADDAVA